MAFYFHEQMQRPDDAGADEQKSNGAKPPNDAFHIINVPPEKQNKKQADAPAFFEQTARKKPCVPKRRQMTGIAVFCKITQNRIIINVKVVGEWLHFPGGNTIMAENVMTKWQ